MIMHQSLIDGFLSKIAGDGDTEEKAKIVKEKLRNLGIGYAAATGGGVIGGALGTAASMPKRQILLRNTPKRQENLLVRS